MREKTVNSESLHNVAGQKEQIDVGAGWRVSLEGRKSLGQLLTKGGA